VPVDSLDTISERALARRAPEAMEGRREMGDGPMRLGHMEWQRDLPVEWSLSCMDGWNGRHNDGYLLRIYVLTNIPPPSVNTTIIECVTKTVTSLL
jgi:hypothetical protein